MEMYEETYVQEAGPVDIEMEDVSLPPIPSIMVSTFLTRSWDSLNLVSSALRSCLSMMVASSRPPPIYMWSEQIWFVQTKITNWTPSGAQVTRN